MSLHIPRIDPLISLHKDGAAAAAAIAGNCLLASMLSHRYCGCTLLAIERVVQMRINQHDGDSLKTWQQVAELAVGLHPGRLNHMQPRISTAAMAAGFVSRFVR